MDKNEARERLARIEQEAKTLRQIIDAPDRLLEKPGSAPFRPVCVIGGFKNEGDSARYARAFRTFIELRQQEGTVPAAGMPTDRSVSGANRCFIEPHWVSHAREWGIAIKTYSGIGAQLARVSPAFASYMAAEKAIENIGEDVLLQMFFTFQHFTPDQAL